MKRLYALIAALCMGAVGGCSGDEVERVSYSRHLCQVYQSMPCTEFYEMSPDARVLSAIYRNKGSVDFQDENGNGRFDPIEYGESWHRGIQTIFDGTDEERVEEFDSLMDIITNGFELDQFGLPFPDTRIIN